MCNAIPILHYFELSGSLMLMLLMLMFIFVCSRKCAMFIIIVRLGDTFQTSFQTKRNKEGRESCCIIPGYCMIRDDVKAF